MARHNRIVDVPAHELKIHPIAQRRLVPAQLKKRMADLDLDAIGVLHGVQLDDGVNVIDGQHRVKALMHHGFGDWKVRVELHPEAVDEARASALFLRLNAKATVSQFDTFLNEVTAGEPIAVGAAKTCVKHGLKVGRQATDGYVACPATIKKIYAIDEGKTLDDTLGILVEAYGRTASAVEGRLIEGLGLVEAAHNGAIDQPVLIKKLSKYPGGASGIIGDARGLKKIRRSSVARCVSETIVEAYNSGRRDPNRLPLP